MECLVLSHRLAGGEVGRAEGCPEPGCSSPCKPPSCYLKFLQFYGEWCQQLLRITLLPVFETLVNK